MLSDFFCSILFEDLKLTVFILSMALPNMHIYVCVYIYRYTILEKQQDICKYDWRFQKYFLKLITFFKNSFLKSSNKATVRKIASSSSVSYCASSLCFSSISLQFFLKSKLFCRFFQRAEADVLLGITYSSSMTLLSNYGTSYNAVLTFLCFMFCCIRFFKYVELL